MSFLPWSDNYSVHIRAIDSDHKELFGTVNQLHEAIEQRRPHEEVSFTINLLARYVKEHFAREEQIMAQYGYPRLAQHKGQHQRLKHMVQAIRRIHDEAPDRLDPKKLLTFLSDWLTNHIIRSDMEYAAYLNSGFKWPLAQKQAEPAPEADDAVQQPHIRTITVEVPAEQADTIRRLAEVLVKGGEDAEAVESFADAINDVNLEEAVKLAAPVLRPLGP